MTNQRSRDAMRSRLCRARDRLCEPGERIPLAAIAREARLSTGELIRRFSALFGETPHQYRLRERLGRAKRLLARGDMMVTEVCLEIGFSSVGSFSALFAERVGIAPSAYRRRASVTAVLPASAPGSLQPGCLSLLAGALADPTVYRAGRDAASRSAISEKR